MQNRQMKVTEQTASNIQLSHISEELKDIDGTHDHRYHLESLGVGDATAHPLLNVGGRKGHATLAPDEGSRPRQANREEEEDDEETQVLSMTASLEHQPVHRALPNANSHLALEPRGSASVGADAEANPEYPRLE